MKFRFTLFAALMVVVTANSVAQFTGYVSAARGYNNNPLYNYQSLSDQLTQTYLQLSYEQGFENSIFNASYVNGLVLFNEFSERNYVEQSLRVHHVIVFWKEEQEVESTQTEQVEADSTDEGNGADETESSNASESQTPTLLASTSPVVQVTTPELPHFEDSIHTYLDFGGKLSGRHDKNVHDEFDNYGAEFSPSYRFMVARNFYLRIGDNFGYRSYVNLNELSNITNVLSLALGNRTEKTFNYGVSIGAGVRRYTRNVYDTTRFEAQRTFVEKPAGKGKFGGKIKVPSGKILLTNSGTSSTYQFVFGGFATTKWEATSLAYSAALRINSKTPSRYIAQTTTNSSINEDIYNDQFSYEGFETSLALAQQLPFAVNATLTLGVQKKKFSASAYDLSGNEIHGNRKDTRGTLELTLAHSFQLSENFSLELNSEFGLMRNKSNDDYSDFSTMSVGIGVGFGF